MERLRTAARGAVSLTLGTARMPVDAAARLLPDGDAGPRRKVVGLVDLTDATVRKALGALLRDTELQADGRRRELAATERLHAVELRLQAEQQRTEADERAATSTAEAEQRREAARRETKAKKESAEELRAARTAAQQQAAAVREEEVDEERRAAQEAVEKTAKRARLAALDDKVEALGVQDDALVATDEAARLTTAAADAKAARKQR
jgi:hypothetical protein